MKISYKFLTVIALLAIFTTNLFAQNDFRKNAKSESVYDNQGTFFLPGDMKVKTDKTLGMEDYYRDPPNVETCKEGFVKEEEIQKVLTMVNYIRSLHDLPPVTYHYEDDAASAKAALMMAAQGAILHKPPISFECYTELGRSVTEKSNLHINMYGSENPSGLATCEDGIRGWLFDNYSGNPEKVGHRRAIINPFLKYFSFGRCDGKPKAASQWPYVTTMTFKFNNDEVQNLSNWDDDFVAYPYHDYPTDLFLKDFYLSFSAIFDKQAWFKNSVDYAQANIEMETESGTKISVHSKDSDNEGWGALTNCLVWMADGLADNVRYKVKITNVKFNGTSKDFEYWFKLGNSAPDALGTPVLVSPSNNVKNQESTIVFKWNSVEDATNYRLQVADNGSFLNPMYDNADLTTTQQEVSGFQKNDTYYWRVLASNSQQKSLFSEIWNFMTKKDDSAPDAPLQLIPADKEQGLSLTPIFSWSNTAGAEGYILQIASDAEFTESSVLIEADRSSNAYKVPSDVKLSPAKEYFWRLNAYGEFGQTDWSDIRSFTTEPASVSEFSKDGFSITNNPNPLSGHTRFLINSPKSATASLEVFSEQGALFSKDINLNFGENSLDLDFSAFPQGAYYYLLTSGKTSIFNKMQIVK